MAVSDPDAGMHDVFRGLLPEHVIVDLPADAASGDALELVLARHAESIAGLIVEPLVQGAGGMRFHDAGTLQRLREVADRCGALLIFDEIFTGFGRTGTMFACEQAGVVPDIITLSQGADRRHLAAGGDGGARRACSRRSGRTIRTRR